MPSPGNPFKAKAVDWQAECKRLLLSKKDLQKRLELSIALNDAQARLAKVLPMTEEDFTLVWDKVIDPTEDTIPYFAAQKFGRSIGLIYDDEPSPEQAEVIPPAPAGQDEADLSSPIAQETGKTSGSQINSIQMFSPYLGEPSNIPFIEDNIVDATQSSDPRAANY